LEDVLNFFHGKDFVFDIELKTAEPNWEQRHFGTEVAKVIRATKMDKQVVVTSFDFFKLHAVEEEYAPLESGWAYADEMSKHLGNSNTWFEKCPDILPDKPAVLENNTHFVHWIMEANVVGKVLGSSVVNIEYTCLDDDSIEKFHAKKHAVGSFTIFAADLRWNQNLLTEEQELNVIRHLFHHKIDWIETDNGLKLMEFLERLKKEAALVESAKVPPAVVESVDVTVEPKKPKKKSFCCF